MAGLNRPAIIIAGIAGLCVSAATGVGLGSYCASGINPIYGPSQTAAAYADDTIALPSGGDSASVGQFSEAAARSLTSRDVADRNNDES